MGMRRIRIRDRRKRRRWRKRRYGIRRRRSRRMYLSPSTEGFRKMKVACLKEQIISFFIFIFPCHPYSLLVRPQNSFDVRVVEIALK